MALREWRPLAERGDAMLQNILGIMYSKGQGVAQDYVEAVTWSRLSDKCGPTSPPSLPFSPVSTFFSRAW